MMLQMNETASRDCNFDANYYCFSSSPAASRVRCKSDNDTALELSTSVRGRTGCDFAALLTVGLITLISQLFAGVLRWRRR
ncbi:hypothetical protein CALVIDRAFT_349903 [Calocera viscosa TUFC12733]|uniref:Uncharacterized protein n=1 Tax=Calocera viscosa (strain TUFC12733) TaxID=1330018 RepID=A0A167QAD4_CALVF|nr:hypothetical protein CALVIDRAFT_349903 [Calocera viscosa TUFC12733]